MKKLLVAVLLLSACSTQSEPAADQLPVIATGAFPIAWLSDRLADDCATIIDLTPAGGDVHDLELSPSQTAAVIDADLIITAPGFQTAFDDAVTSSTATVLDLLPIIDPLFGHDHGHDEDGHSDEKLAEVEVVDPHFWLDPNRMVLAADAAATAIAGLSPACEKSAAANLEQLKADLIALDLQYQAGLSQCQSNTLLVSHEAFSYLADAYDLTQIAIAGLDPESEPSAARINEIIKLAKAEQVAAVFSESSANPAVAEILATELSVGILTLDPIELKPIGLDYLTAMTENLSNLVNGLRCQ